MLLGVLPRVSVLVAVPFAPVVTVAGENVPPPAVIRSVTTTFATGSPSSSVAVTVTVDGVPGAPLPLF